MSKYIIIIIGVTIGFYFGWLAGVSSYVSHCERMGNAKGQTWLEC